jgi:hypothetical protein
MPMFDSSLACLPGLRFWLPGPVRRRISPGCRRGLSVLARAVSRRAFGSWTTPGLAAARAYAPSSVAFPLQAHGRRPEFVFRSSIPRPSMPLSTLHPVPHGTQRKTRGQDGSLLLSRGALSSPTARRFIPTIALTDVRGSVDSEGYRAATVTERFCHRLLVLLGHKRWADSSSQMLGVSWKKYDTKTCRSAGRERDL